VSSLWTPGGERPVDRGPTAPDAAVPTGPAGPSGPQDREPTEEELRQAAEAYMAQLAQTPADIVVGNHVVQLFELARIYLSQSPPKLDDASLAIDAMGALVDGLVGRLGEDEAEMKAGLASLRIAYVQIRAASLGTQGPGQTQGGAP
jgi:hypothetical protein